jgi:hypothetical protein
MNHKATKGTKAPGTVHVRSSGSALPLCVLCVFVVQPLWGSAAGAAPKKRAAKERPAPEAKVEKPAAPVKAEPKEKTFDFAAMGIEGRVLAPQLLYLLGRIKVELERGDLEARSFLPELVRSVDEGGL